MANAKTNEQVHYLEGDFDATALCQIRDLIREATSFAPIILDFRDVRCCLPFALGELFAILARLDGAVRTRGLTQQHDVLLDYLGLKPT